MKIDKYDDYIRIRYNDLSGNVFEFISDNDEFIYILTELTELIQRVNVADLEEPLAGHIKGCIQGKFIQHSNNPEEVMVQLKKIDLERYCKISDNLLYFKPHILNYFMYNDKDL